MGKIILPHQSYAFDDIKGGNWAESEPYFADSLRFCQDWLCGQTSFELKTSGSTGTPKTIRVQRTQMEVSARATQGFFRIAAQPRLLCCLNTAMVAGNMMIVRGMLWDADIYLVNPTADPFSANKLPERFDFVSMVPLQVETCLNNPRGLQKLFGIKHLLIGGAGLSPTLFDKIKEQKLNAYQSFGMTETVSHFALAKIEGENLLYRTLPGVKIGTDDSGKLWVKAPMAIEPLLQTNDLVEMVDEDSFFWKGRADFTINSGGVKIQPEILESQIQPYIQSVMGEVSFFIGGKDDARLGQKTVLILETGQISDSQTESLLSLFQRNIPKYQLPKEIFCVREFVRTSSGKINRVKTLEKTL